MLLEIMEKKKNNLIVETLLKYYNSIKNVFTKISTSIKTFFFVISRDAQRYYLITKNFAKILFTNIYFYLKKQLRKIITFILFSLFVFFIWYFFVNPLSDYYNNHNDTPTQNFKLEFWRAIAQGASAFVTLIVAFIAIFSDTIKGWFFRPNFKISFNCDNIHVRDIKINIESGSRIMKRIFVKIENIRMTKAENCQIYVNSIYKKRVDRNEFETKYLLPPTNFEWYGELKENTIVHMIPSYFFLCELKTVLNFAAEEPDLNNQEQENDEMCLNIKDPNKTEGNILLENGNYIFSIIVNAGKMRKPKRYYLDFTWKGNKLIDLNKETLLINCKKHYELQKNLQEMIKNDN